MKKLTEILKNSKKDIVSESKESYGYFRDRKKKEWVKVRLEYPEKIRNGKKKFRVYVAGDKKHEDLPVAIKIEYGDPNLRIKNEDKGASNNFWARHKCDSKTDKKTAGYWACRTPELHGKRLGLKGGNNRW